MTMKQIFIATIFAWMYSVALCFDVALDPTWKLWQNIHKKSYTGAEEQLRYNKKHFFKVSI